MNINFSVKENPDWQELSNHQQESIQGGVVDTHGRIKPRFFWDRSLIPSAQSGTVDIPITIRRPLP